MADQLIGKDPQPIPDPEVTLRAERRHYTTEYKHRILDEIDHVQEPGQIGAILRREGLYSQLISKWRQQRHAGSLQGSQDRARGPRPHPEAAELKRLRAENERLRARLAQAETIIEVQKKVSQLLGNNSAPGEPAGKTS
jgi:transposase-like protein